MVLIKLPQSQIAPQTKIPAQIDFYFSDRELQDPKSETFPDLSPQLLGDLRYYSLRPSVECSVGGFLSFTSYHLRQSQPTAVIRSKISLQGQIRQEVCQAYLQQPELLQSIVNRHHWLVEHICSRLRINYQPKSQLLAVILTILLAIFWLLIAIFLPLSWAWKVSILGFIVAVGYWLSDRFVNRHLASLIWRELLFGSLVHNSARRRFGWLLWRYFG